MVTPAPSVSPSWSAFVSLAPHTARVLGFASRSRRSIALSGLPGEVLGLTVDPSRPGWAAYLDEPNSIDASITNRELLLRYLLTRAIVDQGSDTVGAEMWHSELIIRCYQRAPPIRLLHRPVETVSNYESVVVIADAVRDWVVSERATLWAAASPRRSIGQYTPYNVDGMLGGKQTHWFLAARLFPALLLAHALPGGLTEIVFGSGPRDERPVEMARRLRGDRRLGLGWSLGDKAADLFAKWAVGTLRLTPEELRPWTSADTVIPMDQRIGRVMMRCGFMDELFGAPRLLLRTPMFQYRGTGRAPADGVSLPEAPYYLRVMEFRRTAAVNPQSPVGRWFASYWRSIYPSRRTPAIRPQDALSLLCAALNAEPGESLTPVEVDDLFMEIGERWCTDQNPRCEECPLASACQANTDPTKGALKRYFT